MLVDEVGGGQGEEDEGLEEQHELRELPRQRQDHRQHEHVDQVQTLEETDEGRI